MSKLLEQIRNCKVEWKPLGEVATKISSGGTPNTKIDEYYNGNIPWLRTQEVDFGEIWDTDVKITEAGLQNSSAKWIPANCVIVAMYGATVGKIAINKIPLTTNQACANIELDQDVLNHKFLFYYLSSQYEYIKSLGVGSQTNINAQIVKKLSVPIPPLPLQSEIVRILDVFTAITSELTSELTLRRKQYQYYRDKLLSFGDNVEWKMLGEIAQYSKQRISADKLNETNYVGVDNLLQDRLGKTISNYPPTTGNFTQYVPNDILIGNIRPYLKKIWFADNAGGTNGDVLVIHLTDNAVEPRYLYQALADDKFFAYNMKHAKGAKMPRGDKSAILNYKIPIPPLAEQQRIVAILDKFDTLVNSLTAGLPKEIELRQKQYEYYRELLLGFPKPSC